MARKTHFSFFPLVIEDGPVIPRAYLLAFRIDDCELNILWFLVENGPCSIYDLAKTRYCLPSHVSALAISGDFERMGKEITYHYPDIHKGVTKLEMKNLIESHKDISGPRIRKVVKPTLLGIVLYIQASDKKTVKQKLWDKLKHHSVLLPFSETWDQMEETVGKEKLFSTLIQTARSFSSICRVMVKIKPLELEFEGFLKQEIFTSSKDERKIPNEGYKAFSEFLRKPEALVLRNSYIAYLAIGDIALLSKKGSKIEDLPASLVSENELAFFEERKTGSDSLFKDARLKEFFPKYATLENFFTGMLVENLLWEKTEEKGDFEIQFVRQKS